MKTNGKKAIIATMAIAMAAGIAGSISGTVAWFQYNTRSVAEFTGTTAKCTEFLQVRTKKNVLALEGSGTTLPTSGYKVGDRFLKTDEKKVYTCITLNGAKPVFDAGFAAQTGGIYKVGTGDNQKFDGSALAAATDADLFGDWKTSLTNEDILVATAGASDSGLKPVTYPGDVKDAAFGTLYGQPVCGYEKYVDATGYHWQEAEASDYYGFDLQFRVLDIDGSEADGTPALYAQDIYLMDISVAQITVSGKKDISSALRVFVDGGDVGKRALLGPDAGSSPTGSTVTHGALDLGGEVGNDTLRDVPNAYSFNTAATALDYGKDIQTQTFYNLSKKMTADNNASNGIYPKNDGKGHLTEGRVFGTTQASDGLSAVANNLHPTVNFKIFLEGWQKLGEEPEITATADQLAAAEPATPAADDTYINTGTNKLFTYDGSTWDTGVDLVDGKFYSVGGVVYKYVSSGASVAQRYVPQSSLSTWSSKDYIGAKFNIGMSFGVTTLD